MQSFMNSTSRASAHESLDGALSALARPALLALLISVCLLAFARAGAAQAGVGDPTFNVLDDGTFGDGANGPVHTVAETQDGKLLIGGAFTRFNGAEANRIARLDADGRVDASFDPGAGANGLVWRLALQPDGKALVAGEFTSYDGVARSRLARVNADGELDTSFDPGAGANGSVDAIAVQPDGKLLIGGGFTSYAGVERLFVARLNADGSLDASFDPAIGASGAVYALALQPDGRVLIGGAFQFFDGAPRGRVARLNADGSLDASFDPGDGANDFVAALALTPDGRVLLGGLFTSFDSAVRRRTARLHPDGSLDTSYDPGAGANSSVSAFALQPDGKVLVGGDFTLCAGVTRSRVARLNGDGALDTSFDPGTGAAGGFVATTAHALVLRADGALVIGGDFESFDGAPRRGVVRVEANGAVDADFNPGAGASDKVDAVAVQPDGKILIGGDFLAFNNTVRNRIARLRPDGSLDASFEPGGGADGRVTAIAVAQDGKVLIGGYFQFFDGEQRRRIARLHADGSLDVSFDPGSGANGPVWSLAPQADGKVLIGGDFSSFDGVGRNNLARVNADGSLDLSFSPGSGASDTVWSVALQPNGKALIGGGFTAYNGVARPRIARVNANGSLATGFDPGAGANDSVLAIALQPDGKALIGGSFTACDGVARNSIARLNADGSLDASFDPGSGADGFVQALAVQPDGNVLIAGSFLAYGGVARRNIARLNADGSLDASFDPGSGADAAVHALALQADGRLLIGGAFASYDGATRQRVARVFTVAPGVTTRYCTAGVSAIGCTPTMSAAGVASASAASGYVVTTANIEGQRQTSTFYSLHGPKNPPTPFGAGLLCVRTPVQRIGSVPSNGTPGVCDGSVSIDVLDWAQSHSGAQGLPFMFGTTLNFQCAVRDPLSAAGRVMSDALQVALLP